MLYIVIAIIHEYDDTVIMNGIYNNIPCVIKRVSIDDIYGIKSKVLREISALQNNKHKNVLKLINVIIDKKYVHIILEKGLSDIMQVEHDTIDKLKITQDITSALVHLQNNNYVHGDLSLKNVVQFRDNNGKICYKLIDFGNAIRSYRKSALEQPTFYISPVEMLSKKPDIFSHMTNIVLQKIDAWGLGCILYYVLTKTILFIENDEDQMGQNIEKIYGSIGEKLKDFGYDNCDVLAKYVKKLINASAKKRYDVAQFYKNIKTLFSDTCNGNNTIHYINNDNQTNKQENNVASYILHSNDLVNNEYDSSTRNELLELLLFMSTEYNIPIEAIFITIELLQKLKYICKTNYLINGLLLFSLVTKLVSPVEFPIEYLIYVITTTLKCVITKKCVDNKIVNLLKKFDWNIDIPNLLNFILKIPSDQRMTFISVALIMLFYDEFYSLSLNCTFLVIKIILGMTKNKSTVHQIKQQDNIKTHVSNVLNYANHFNQTKYFGVYLNYFEHIEVSDPLDWTNKCNMSRIVFV